MSTLEKWLIAGIVLCLVLGIGAVWAGMRYPVAPEAIIVPAPTVPDFGYAVAPGWQMTPTPGAEQALAEATPMAEPTYAWLQPGRDISCERLGQLVEAAMNYSCREALIASQKSDPHMVIALRTEPGAQLTNVHEFGSSNGVFYYVLFEQALIVWKQNDARILVASPVNGCWQGLPQAAGDGQ